MNFVVDASVAAKWLIQEDDSDKAEDLLIRWQRNRIELTAPRMISAEVANVLWKKTLRGLLPADRATGLYADFVQLGLPLTPIEDFVAPALDLAVEHGCSVYDGLYIALALDLGWSVMTADQKLFNALGSAFPQLHLLKNWA
jgi:predicted nucleic acid-binding protein